MAGHPREDNASRAAAMQRTDPRMLTTDLAASEPMRVLVASFTFCDDEHCQFVESTHLLVSRSYVLLETGNAFAISYTWGEYDRHEISLGHDERGHNVPMTLGCEWSRSDVVEKLLHMGYALTTEDTAMPFWIDQLCIPQDNEAVIRQTLAAIPQIFNVFDAIALLPGSPCKCLQEGIEQYGRHHLFDPSHEQLAQLSIQWAQKMALCVNSISFCSYFERVWTRQEMVYTRKMHVEWTGSEVSRCVVPSNREGDIMFDLLDLHDNDGDEEEGQNEDQDTVEDEDEDEDNTDQVEKKDEEEKKWKEENRPVDDHQDEDNKKDEDGAQTEDEDENAIKHLDKAEGLAMEAERNLAPFARQVYQKALSTDITHTHALARVKMKHDKAWHNSVLAFEDFLSRDTARAHERYFAIQALCQFLIGVPLEIINGKNERGNLSDIQKLRKFASRLSGVGWVQRSATRQRDYVLAVWIDCPCYVVPEDYNIMSLSHLLEDAILQMERNFSVTVPVTAFAGLFGCPRPSAVWRPTWYLPDLVYNTQQIYGTVVMGSPLVPFTNSSSLPLIVYRPRMGRARDRVLFADIIRGKTAEQILRLVHGAVMLWPTAIMERIQSGRKTEFEDPLEGLSAGIKAMLLLVHPVMNQLFAETVQNFNSIEAMGFHTCVIMIENDIERFQDIVFELVCEALGLFLPAKPFRQSLQLIFRQGEDPAIGICRQDWPDQDISLNSVERAETRVTICRDDAAPGSGCTVLEAVRVESENEPLDSYMGIGIWVPQTVTAWQDIGGTIVQTSQNAFLV